MDSKVVDKIIVCGFFGAALYKNLVEIVIFQRFCPASATQYTDPDDIKPVSIDHWHTVACQIWPIKDREFAHAAGFAEARRCLQFLVANVVACLDRLNQHS